MSMKPLLVLATLGTVLVAPAFLAASAFAQHEPGAEQHRRSTVPPGGIFYYQRHNHANPDSRLGGGKTNHKKSKHESKHDRHHQHSGTHK